jgi:O-Antigen ligase
VSVSSLSTARASAKRSVAVAWPALVPCIAFPILFLHVDYQPGVDVGIGSTTVGIELSDVAALGVAAAAVVVGRREGWQPLRASRGLWLAALGFLAVIAFGTIYGALRPEAYAFTTHFVTAAKFGEYALLAPAVPLLISRPASAYPLLWTVAGWSACATGWGVLQFAGVVEEFNGLRPLQREPSFVGIHDFSALSGAALAIALALLVAGEKRTSSRVLALVGGVSGALGLALAGAVTGVAGFAAATVAALAIAAGRGHVEARRAVAAFAVVVLVAAGVLLMRGGEVERTLRGIGLGSEPKKERAVESYQERTLLGYIGLRMFLDHPVAGVGWQGSHEESSYRPYLAAAHRRYPDAPEIAFPSPAHSWGVQNAYLQTLADLGLIGALALLALLATGIASGVRSALRAPPAALAPALVGLLWLLVACGVWNGLGLVAGIPNEALTWLALGMIGAAAAWRELADAG